MDEFTLQGYSDYLKISLEEVFGFPNDTSPFGGYDTRSIIDINSNDFKVKTTFCITTGEIFEFCEALSNAMSR